MPTQADELATLGVGRIPLESLDDALVFSSAGCFGERLLAHRPPRRLTVATPRTPGLAAVRDNQPLDGGRVQELWRTRSRVYGRNTNSPEILMAARSANLILYEGHLNHQELIVSPILRPSRPEYYPLDEDDLNVSGRNRLAVHGDAGPMPVPRLVSAEPMSQRMEGPLGGLFPLSFCRLANRWMTQCSGDWTKWRGRLDRQHDVHP